MTAPFSETGYKRNLGLPEATSIVVSRIIGSGIFRVPGPILGYVASSYLFGVTWIIGGLVTVFGAVIYAELAAMLPKSGGPYVYLKEAYHPVIPFLRGWAMFFVSETGAIAAVSLVFAEYFNALVTSMGYSPFSHTTEIILALGTLWFLTAANMFGVALSGKQQNFFGTVKVLAITVIILSAFFSDHGTTSHFTFNTSFTGDTLETIKSIGKALMLAFFAFSGWEGSTYVAEEVKKPERNLPLALLIGISLVMVLYIGANLSYFYLLPGEVMKNSKWVATDAMMVAMGTAGGIFISAAVMINTFGNISTQVLVKARTWHAMARDGLFFSWLRELHKEHGTPNRSLVAQGVWGSFLLVAAATVSDSYERIIEYFSATSTIFNILTFYSIARLRKKLPELHRPYRAWFYPVSLWLIITVYILFLMVTLISAPIPSLLGLLLTSSGFLYYFLAIKS